MTDSQKQRLRTRCTCAWNWITTFAPEDFKYRLSNENDPKVELTEQELKAVKALYQVVEVMDQLEDKEYTTRLYDAAKLNDLDTGEFFKLVYRIMIGKDRGPKLGPFLQTCGKEKVLSILGRY
ncbi:Lysine--tRNA ligase [bioreactor metagenome]|uniref:Lysine--tRNA ligase n=1 Tax=bioreactor metagenome TaxID=1076179 RepID=A0A644YLE8_9ZZZZ